MKASQLLCLFTVTALLSASPSRADSKLPELLASEMPTAPELRSSKPGPKVDIVFVNTSSEPIQLYWMKGNGDRHPVKLINPGGQAACGTAGGYVYTLVAADGSLIKALAVPNESSRILVDGPDWEGAPTSSMKFETVDRTRSTGRSVPLAIRNGTRAEIGVYWLDMSGNEKLYSDVKPGNTYTVKTSEWHVWIIRDAGGNLMAKFEVDPDQPNILVDGPGKE